MPATRGWLLWQRGQGSGSGGMHMNTGLLLLIATAAVLTGIGAGGNVRGLWRGARRSGLAAALVAALRC